MHEALNALVLHWTPEKAIWIGGATLPWDARCAGIYVGFGIGALYHCIAARRANRLPPPTVLVLVAALFLPLFLNVGTAHFGLRAASNDLRLLTGMLFGVAASIVLYPAAVECVAGSGSDRSALPSVPRLALLLIITASAFEARNLDSKPAFHLLEALGIMGNVALYLIVGLGPFAALGRRRLQRQFK